MTFLKRIFASNSAAPRASNSPPASQISLPASSQSQTPAAQQNSSRRELVRVVLRDTLNRTGIPTSWIGVDLLAATSRGREPGIHVRLLVKHWDPRLMQHGVAFQNAFHKRVLTLDPQAERWLLGISWQFSLADEASCPPMPHPGTWTSSAATAALATAAAAAASAASKTAMAKTEPADLLGGSIVISGPAASPEPSAARPAAAAATAGRQGSVAPSDVDDSKAAALADLDRLFAARDEDMKRHADAAAASGGAFAATEPANLTSI